jgi:hypothetical protein
MRETTALLGLAVDGAPRAVDAAQAVVDHLAAEDPFAPAVYLARSGRLRRVASSGQWVAEDGIPPATGAVGRAYRTGSEVAQAGAAGDDGSDVPAWTVCLPILAAGRPAGVLEVRSTPRLTAEDLEHARGCAAALGRRIETHA